MLTPSEMKDHLHRLAREGNFIEGIYNYCDRWCEHCSFTSRCLNFKSSKDAPDADSPDLFEYLSNVFEATMLMINEKMEELGIDPAEIAAMETPEEPDPRDHPLHKKAYNAAFETHKWLEKHKPAERIHDVSTLVLSEKNMHFAQAVEAIYWYNFFVSAKIYRALIPDDIHDRGEIQTDQNGSAKIALIALDRLIGAWSVVMENMNDHEDEILPFLITLAEIRRQAEITFPLAKQFLRPGFDD
ncbi:MAG: hypothetical protein LLG13_10615 [Bacteroidales bacterium]|nr:hypothetical protein [Bacteroidales bacterium]